MNEGRTEEPTEAAEEAERAPTILPYETWSSLSVLVMGLDVEAREDILDAAEIDPDDYEASAVHWALAMVNELTANDFVRAEAYGRKCVDEVERRKTAPAPESAPVSTRPAAPVSVGRAVPVDVPTFLREPMATPERPPLVGAAPARVAPLAPVDLDRTGEIVRPASRPTLPFTVAGPPGPTPPAPPAPPQPPKQGQRNPLGTTMATPGSPQKPTMPFTPKKGGS